MLKTLTLINFKRHGNLTVEFSPGVNIICGPNYSGKSTILQGILFALWGVSAVPGGATCAWKHGSATTKVVLTLQAGQSAFSIERTKTSARLFENGKEIATGTTAVNGRIESVLGITKLDFNKIKYAEQGETSALLEFGAIKLNEMIERLSGANVITDVLAKLKDYKLRKEGAASALTYVDPEPVSNILPTLLELKESIRADIAKLEGEKTKTSERFKVAKTFLDHLREQNTKAANVNAARERLEALIVEATEISNTAKAQVAALELTLSSTEEVSAWKTSLAELNAYAARLPILLKQKLNLQATLRKTVDDLANLQSVKIPALSKIADTKLSLQAKAAALSGALDECTTAHSVLASEIAHLSQCLNDLVCPTCNRAYDATFDSAATKELLKDKTAAQEELAEKLPGLKKAVAEATSALKQAEQAGTELRIAEESTVPSLQASLNDCNVNLTVLNKQLAETPENLQDRVSKLTADIAAATSAENHYNLLQETLRNKLTTLANLEAELSSTPEAQPIEDLTPLITEVGEFEANWLGITEKLTGLKTKASNVHRDVLEVEAKLASAIETNARLDALTSELAVASSLQSFLKTNRETCLSQIWDTILSVASSICNDITNGAITAITRQDDSFFYEESERLMPIASASGAQKSIIGVALKLAISGIIPETLNCLLIDEATADMDESHAQATTHMLGTTGQQVISVSHRDLDKSGECNLIQLG